MKVSNLHVKTNAFGGIEALEITLPPKTVLRKIGQHKESEYTEGKSLYALDCVILVPSDRGYEPIGVSGTVFSEAAVERFQQEFAPETTGPLAALGLKDVSGRIIELAPRISASGKLSQAFQFKGAEAVSKEEAALLASL